MAYKYFKYFIVLLACWCCTTVAFAQTDTTLVATDTSYADADTTGTYDSAGSNSDDSTYQLAVNKFNLKQQQPVVAERKLPASSIKQLKEDEDFWYRDKEVGKEKPEDDSGNFWVKLFSSKLLYIIFWIIVIGAFVGVVVVYILNGNMWVFARRGKRIRAGAAVEAAQQAENIFTIDFDAAISRAVNEHNYRLATRLLFLRLLRKMTEKSIIQYGVDKTNMDYLFELGNTRYFKDFAQASRAYEYVWYGNFDVQQHQFGAIKERLDEFNQKLNG